MSEGWINVADFERVAAEKLDAGVLGYFAGGAGDELTLRDNVAAWWRWRLRPRVLVDVSEVTTEAEVLGGPVSMPMLVAPVAYQRLVDPEGEIGMARAAAAAGTVMCLSTLATTRPSELAAAAPAGRRWFQLYCFRDEAVTRALMDEAIESGFEAIVVTVDAPRGGNRERDRRTGFRIPAGLGVPSVAAAMGVERAVTIEETFALMDPALGWPDLERLASECSLPVLVKGLLTAEDASWRSSTAPPGSSSPTTAGASSTGRWPPATPCRRSSMRSTAAPRCWSTAASAAASTSRSPSPSAPTRSWSGDPRSGASPPPARRARPGAGAAPRRAGAGSGALRLRLAGGPDPRPRAEGTGNVRIFGLSDRFQQLLDDRRWPSASPETNR